MVVVVVEVVVTDSTSSRWPVARYGQTPEPDLRVGVIGQSVVQRPSRTSSTSTSRGPVGSYPVVVLVGQIRGAR